jgi:hypothetical protein
MDSSSLYAGATSSFRNKAIDADYDRKQARRHAHPLHLSAKKTAGIMARAQ